MPQLPRRCSKSIRVPRRGRAGFTLLEVLLAVTIFAILGMIILSTFRTGTRAYEDAERQATLVDQARFTFDALERDIHASYIKSEAEYNRSIREKLNRIQQAMGKAEWSENWDEVQKMTGYGLDPSELLNEQGQYPEGYLGNPLATGILLDLSMYSEPAGDDTKLSFVIYKPIEPGRTAEEWGLIRVTYQSQGGVLVRSENPIIEPMRDIFGQLIEEPPKPEQEIMAQGVVRFDLRFGYWFDEVWLESNRWNSTRREFRNSFDLWSPDPDEEKEQRRNEPGTPEWQNYQQLMNQAPEDQAPAYVRVFLELADLKNPKRTETYTTLIRLPQSQETFLPNAGIEDEQRDMEIEARKEMDSRYRNDRGAYGVGSRGRY